MAYPIPTGSVYAPQGNTSARLDIGKDTPKPSLISQQTSTLEIRVEALHEVVTQLEQRLQAVTMPEQPIQASNKTSGPEIGSPVVMAQRLSSINARLEAAHDQLSSLLTRNEL